MACDFCSLRWNGLFTNKRSSFSLMERWLGPFLVVFNLCAFLRLCDQLRLFRLSVIGGYLMFLRCLSVFGIAMFQHMEVIECVDIWWIVPTELIIALWSSGWSKYCTYWIICSAVNILTNAFWLSFVFLYLYLRVFVVHFIHCFQNSKIASILFIASFNYGTFNKFVGLTSTYLLG